MEEPKKDRLDGKLAEGIKSDESLIARYREADALRRRAIHGDRVAFGALVEAVQHGDGIALIRLGMIVAGSETAEVLSKLRRETAGRTDEMASAAERTVLGIVKGATDLLSEVARDEKRSPETRGIALNLLSNGTDGGHDFGLKKMAELAREGNRDALWRLVVNVYRSNENALKELATLAGTESGARLDAAKYLIGIAKGLQGVHPLAPSQQPDLNGADAAVTDKHPNPQAVAELVEVAVKTLKRTSPKPHGQRLK